MSEPPSLRDPSLRDLSLRAGRCSRSTSSPCSRRSSSPLLIAGGSEAWFGYHDQRARLNDILDAEARLAAVKIQDFIEGIREQLGWTVQLPWSENTGERHRLDALRLLRQVAGRHQPHAGRAAGRERLFVSRIGLNRIESGEDHSARARGDGRPLGRESGLARSHSSDGSEPS